MSIQLDGLRRTEGAVFGSLVLLAVALTLTGCATVVGRQMDHHVYDGVATATNGCKMRYPTKGGAEIVNLQWTGSCDGNGFATGNGVFAAAYADRYLTDLKTVATETMNDGIPNGSFRAITTYRLNGATYKIESNGTYVNGQIEGTETEVRYEDGAFSEKSVKTVQNGTIVSYSAYEAEKTQEPSSSDGTGLAIAGAILSTAIQAKGMQIAAAQQHATQVAATQAAQAERQALLAAAAATAAAQASKSAAQPQPEAAPSNTTPAPTFSASTATASNSPKTAPASYPKQSPASSSAPTQSAPSGPPSFTSTDQERCDDVNDPMSCTYAVLVTNQSTRGIMCNAMVTLYRTNSVTGGTDTLYAQDVGYVPAQSTSSVSSNLAKSGAYNVSCSYQ